jgi:phenylacetate-CoA ligase
MIHSITRNDKKKFPTLTDAGRQMLMFLKEHPNAPIFHDESGNCQTPEDLVFLRDYCAKMVDAPIVAGYEKPWLDDFLETSIRTVPYYRNYGSQPKRLSDWPTISREELSADITRFVPDHQPTERLIHYKTSGTSGHPLLVPSHPRVAGCYLAYQLRALKRFGITLKHRAGKVGVVILGFQRACFTYVSVTPLLNESGLSKINLHPDDWRRPGDRNKYLEALDAEVVAGDPISFLELLRLGPAISPRAIFSTAMTLETGLRKQLEERYRCPVLDFYSLNEAGPIAVYDPALGGHVLLQPRMVVEILDDHQEPLLPGERGEITLTGGFNFCLPLVRYRTGDYASLAWRGGEPVLIDFHGRPPVCFAAADGRQINNVDVTHVLAPLALNQYTLHQRKNGEIQFTGVNINGKEEIIGQTLKSLFGTERSITIVSVDSFPGKVIQYTREQ